MAAAKAKPVKTEPARFVIDVHYRDGSVIEAVIAPTLQIAFEREFSVGIIAYLAAFPNWQMTHFYWLAWKALGAGLELEAWVSTVDGIDLQKVLTGLPDESDS